jgi:hypothetical protein
MGPRRPATKPVPWVEMQRLILRSAKFMILARLSVHSRSAGIVGVIVKMRVSMFAIAMLMAINGDAEAQKPATTVPPTVVYTSYSLNNLGSLRVVVHDREHFQQYWDKIVGSGPAQRPLPDVDFAKYQLIIASLGVQGRSGSSIGIKEVKYKDNLLDVWTELHFSGSNCGPAPAELVSPTVIVRAPATGGIAVFHDRAIVTRC